MEGLLFYDTNRGGSEYFVSHSKWCVNSDNIKYHIDNKAVTFHGDKIPEITLEVSPCDGSCQKIEKIPDDTWEKAQLQIKSLADAQKKNSD